MPLNGSLFSVKLSVSIPEAFPFFSISDLCVFRPSSAAPRPDLLVLNTDCPGQEYRVHHS